MITVIVCDLYIDSYQDSFEDPVFPNRPSTKQSILEIKGRFVFPPRACVYDEDMKFARFALLLALPVLSAAPELMRVQSIYVLGMGSGLDQYLINRIVSKGEFTVVTDPQKADAIFTDRVGESMDTKLDALLAPKTVVKKKKDKDKDEDDDKGVGNGAAVRLTSFSRGRGTVFLIDRNSRNVLWSTYARPKSTNSDELNRVADEIIERLEKAHKGK